MISACTPFACHMRIGTYNVLGFRGYPPEAAAGALRHPDDPAAAAHFARVFEALRCDVLAVQEGPSARQMHRVAGLLGYDLAGFSSPLYWPGYLLTRYPVLGLRTLSRWRPLADRWPFSRMGGSAVLRLDDGSRLLAVGLHLHPRHEHIRRVEAALVLRAVGRADAGRGARRRAGRLQLHDRRADPRRSG